MRLSSIANSRGRWGEPPWDLNDNPRRLPRGKLDGIRCRKSKEHFRAVTRVRKYAKKSVKFIVACSCHTRSMTKEVTLRNKTKINPTCLDWTLITSSSTDVNKLFIDSRIRGESEGQAWGKDSSVPYISNRLLRWSRGKRGKAP